MDSEDDFFPSEEEKDGDEDFEAFDPSDSSDADFLEEESDSEPKRGRGKKRKTPTKAKAPAKGKAKAAKGGGGGGGKAAAAKKTATKKRTARGKTKKASDDEESAYEDDMSVTSTPKRARVKKGTPAKKKAKPKAIPEKEAYSVLLDYVNTQNKPYSAINIFDNLHGAVKKASVTRVLDNLADEGKIMSKVFGKFKLYYPDQQQYGDIGEDVIDDCEARLKAANETAMRVKAEKLALSSRVASLQSALTDEELDKQIQEHEEKIKAAKERLSKLKEGGVELDPERRKKTEAKLKKFKKLWGEYRSKVQGTLSDMSEGMEKKISEVEELVGIETDEDAGLNYKEFFKNI